MILPGSGQWQLGHKVKGSFLLGTEAVLLASGINDGFYLTSKWQTRVEAARVMLSGNPGDSLISFGGKSAYLRQVRYTDSLQYYQGELLYSESIRNRTLVWAAGFHFYNVMDCYGTMHPRLDDRARSPKGAFLRSLILPGWGQLYNGAYAKFGLVVMSAAGFAANIHGWQRSGDYFAGMASRYHTMANSMTPALDDYNHRIQSIGAHRDSVVIVLKDTALTPLMRDSLETVKAGLDSSYNIEGRVRGVLLNDQGAVLSREADFTGGKERYYSWRNQNIWYCVALYFYAAFDAYVDAHLSAFDNRLNFALLPQGGGLTFSANIKL